MVSDSDDAVGYGHRDQVSVGVECTVPDVHRWVSA